MQRLLFAIAAVAAFGLVQAHAQGASEGASQGDPQRGKALFAADGCYECHGYVGQGSIRTGPTLAPKVIPFAAFQAQLRKPADRMPPYTEAVLPESGLQDIYAYLQSVPKPPNPADVPILQP